MAEASPVELYWPAGPLAANSTVPLPVAVTVKSSDTGQLTVVDALTGIAETTVVDVMVVVVVVEAVGVTVGFRLCLVTVGFVFGGRVVAVDELALVGPPPRAEDTDADVAAPLEMTSATCAWLVNLPTGLISNNNRIETTAPVHFHPPPPRTLINGEGS